MRLAFEHQRVFAAQALITHQRLKGFRAWKVFCLSLSAANAILGLSKAAASDQTTMHTHHHHACRDGHELQTASLAAESISHTAELHRLYAFCAICFPSGLRVTLLHQITKKRLHQSQCCCCLMHPASLLLQAMLLLV